MESIRNFFQLTPNIGSGGQPTVEQFQLIADNGYQHVINLGMPDHVDAVPDEDKRLSALQLNYLHIPVSFDAPRPDQLKLFCQVMNCLCTDKVFVHCIMNYRASAFLYQYLTKMEALEEQQARSPVLDFWNPPPVWQEVMSWSREDIGL
ncbi:protein tyrosine phosphatase family protein [Saccharospirillum mangrovi]|uniref:protein tyrosine phosphatase family protein n=1 Tax=Saccharospirillum mangrovi TaxID=2161747 RepID=UPI000D3D8C66|nr:protein tyrosine phosphatase family protein [Saccharospirillum mangrovi]